MQFKYPGLLLFTLSSLCVLAQEPITKTPPEKWQTEYRAAPEKVNALVHTKLEAKFDYSKSQLNGKAWITLRPFFYPVDSVSLDAKSMDIRKVQLVQGGKNVDVKYAYDGLKLNVRLGKTYKRDENYTLYIDYTAKPNEHVSQGSAAIKDDKGLYFINPTGEDKTKPIQIWTQGETEATSVWIPTIDKPNQKTTQEMYLTVPDKYVSLSNGKLISQKKNTDGTRTDYWKMDQPHAPYLFFIGVGDYAVIKDTYKGKEVNYYVEPEYKAVARKIFGHTPEMMKFFSEKLGIEYPWIKYSQMTARDYVSGAMENTTATLHSDMAQQNERELVDGNMWESVIAHELFHHWFGDLVTAESWSNLTVNESFADYSETLWEEYKYGPEAGEYANYTAEEKYLQGNDQGKDLVRYYYKSREDMFDLVSYQKGGRVLHMLRNYVGDDGFFKSLNTYLTRNLYGTGNARELQQAFEDVTGKDLNWFFDQWYFGAGHPEINISYEYQPDKKQTQVVVKQLQEGEKAFRMPFATDVYSGGKVTRFNKWIQSKLDTFYFPSATKPDLVNVDADKVWLAVVMDNKTGPEYLFQYKNGKKLLDRMEAIQFASALADSLPEADEILKLALNDKHFSIRQRAVEGTNPYESPEELVAKIEKMASSDPKPAVRSSAIMFLAQGRDEKYKSLYEKATRDSSYTVAGSALLALQSIDEPAALALVAELKKDMRGMLEQAIRAVEVTLKGDADFDEYYLPVKNGNLQERYDNLINFIKLMDKINNVENFKKGVDLILEVRDQILPYVPNFKGTIVEVLKGIKEKKKLNPDLSPENLKVLEAYLDEAIAK